MRDRRLGRAECGRGLQPGERILEVLVGAAAVPARERRLERLSALLDGEEHDGDVVLAASPVRRLHERLRRRVEVVRLGDEPEDVLVGHHRRQAVGAEQVGIARARLDDEAVDVDLMIGAEGPRDDRALRMRLRLLGCEPPASHQIGDEGVVVGQLLEPPLVDPVGARVADVADEHATVLEQSGRDRRPHPGGAGVADSALVDPAVRLLDDRPDALLRLELVRLVELAEGSRREPRGDLARLGPAHAVGDCKERRLEDERVLVPAPLPPRVGPPRRPG